MGILIFIDCLHWNINGERSLSFYGVSVYLKVLSERCVRFSGSGFVQLDEVLSFASPKESTQRKGDPPHWPSASLVSM